jgi:hypothetical protein
MNRYWHQRYSLFSKYDDGVQLTDDAWFSVTPESVAKYVASPHTRCHIADETAKLLTILLIMRQKPNPS